MKTRTYCRAVLIDGKELMSWAADYASLRASESHLTFETWHTRITITAPKDKLLFIEEPIGDKKLAEFQDKDQLFP